MAMAIRGRGFGGESFVLGLDALAILETRSSLVDTKQTVEYNIVVAEGFNDARNTAAYGAPPQ